MDKNMNAISQKLRATEGVSNTNMMKLKALRPNVVFSSIVVTVGISAVVSTAMPAGAVSIGAPPPVWFGYGCVTKNNAANCQTGKNQFVTKVSQVTLSNKTVQVLFQFFNKGPKASSITQIYFDDTNPFSLSSVAKIFNSSGVNFSQKYSGPRNLPGGNNINFTADYSVGPVAPVQPNGVNPGEVVGVLFNTRSGFSDPFNAIINDLQTSSLRVGIHAQGFQNGGSESFVNEAVPEPMTVLGPCVALGIGAWLQRKSAKIQKTKS